MQVYNEPTAAGQPQVWHPLLHAGGKRRSVARAIPQRLLPTVDAWVWQQLRKYHRSPHQPGASRIYMLSIAVFLNIHHHHRTPVFFDIFIATESFGAFRLFVEPPAASEAFALFQNGQKHQFPTRTKKHQLIQMYVWYCDLWPKWRINSCGLTISAFIFILYWPSAETLFGARGNLRFRGTPFENQYRTFYWNLSPQLNTILRWTTQCT